MSTEPSTDANELAANTRFLADEDICMVTLVIPHPDGTATMNNYVADARTRALVEAIVGPAFMTALLTADAMAAHNALGMIPMMRVESD